MNSPAQPPATPAKKATPLVRFLRIFIIVCVVLVEVPAIFGTKNSGAPTPPADGPTEAKAPASAPVQAPAASSNTAMRHIMDRAKAFVGGGEWEEFVEDGFKLLAPGRSRDFKAARVSGIHEVSVRKLRGNESGRFAVSIVVYLDETKRDGSGRYQEYPLIADWIAQLESWPKNGPVVDESKVAALRFMAAKLPAALATPATTIETFSAQNGLSFSFMTGGKGSVGQVVKWLSVETTMPMEGSAHATAPQASMVQTTQEQLAKAEVRLEAAVQVVDAKLKTLRQELDRAAEGVETVGEVMTVARLFQEGNEGMAQHLMEQPEKYRSLRYRKQLVAIRDARRVVDAVTAEIVPLRKQRWLEKRAVEEEQRRSGGVQVPAPTSSQSEAKSITTVP